MIQRYSSRRSPLKDFLATQLEGARRYDRITGFFSSSLLEVAGEALERMTPDEGETCVRVVYNSCLNPLDVQTARAAKWGMHREWCASLPAEIGTPMKARLRRLYEQGVAYPEFGPQGMRKCPRRIGIMSTGLIILGSETVDWESCSRVLDSASQLEALRKGWRGDSRS